MKTYTPSKIARLQAEVEALRTELSTTRQQLDAARSEAADYWAAQWNAMLNLRDAAIAWRAHGGDSLRYGPALAAAVDALPAPEGDET